MVASNGCPFRGFGFNLDPTSVCRLRSLVSRSGGEFSCAHPVYVSSLVRAVVCFGHLRLQSFEDGPCKSIGGEGN